MSKAVPSGSRKLGKVGHIHECLINEMIADPTITQKTLCEMFGYTAGWLSRIINSDSFQARLAERRSELLDPDVRARLNARMKSVVLQSVNQIARKLDAEANADLALGSLGVLTQALGMTALPKE